MRVIAGRFKGHGLKAPTWDGLRPSSDRLRETLFNVLRERVAGARVLDLCAGTGAVGLEALSRGAAHVTFVEADARASALIHANLEKCRVSEGYTIEHRDGLVSSPSAYTGSFDIVFLDPPYAQVRLDAWLAVAATAVAPDGLVVLEHARHAVVPDVAGLARTRELRQGDSTLTFFAPETEPAAGA